MSISMTDPNDKNSRFLHFHCVPIFEIVRSNCDNDDDNDADDNDADDMELKSEMLPVASRLKNN